MGGTDDSPKRMPLSDGKGLKDHTAAEHICAKKHGVGHDDLDWIQREAYKAWEMAKVSHDKQQAPLACIEVIHPETNRRIHVEVVTKSNTLFNAWDPTRDCGKSHSHLPGTDYAAYNSKSNRYHRTDTPRKGQFAKGTKGEADGLVTDDDKRGQWINPRTSSPHPDPITGSPSRRRDGGGNDGGGNNGGGNNGGDKKGGGNNGGGNNGGGNNGGGNNGGGNNDFSSYSVGTNPRGELVEMMTKLRSDGLEEIHYKATKTTKDGTTTAKYKNESPADALIGHSKYFETEESLKGNIFKTRHIGKGELDKRSLETRMVHCEKEIFEVRDEVKAAFGRGMEVGALQIRKANEQKLLVTEQQEKEATSRLATAMVSQGVGETLGLLAAEKAGRSLPGVHSAPLVEAAFAGSAAFLQEGTGSEKVGHAAAAAGTSLALSAAHEAASGVVGQRATAGIAGRAIGAFVTSQGSCTDRLGHAAQAAGEGAVVQAAGMALAKSGVPLCPTGLINEEGRKGIEFAGGSSVSVGHRDRFGEEQLQNGTQISARQHEEGVQFRAGLGTALAVSGAGPLASGLGSAVGVSGNLGVTHRERHEQKVDGSFKSHAETVRGFAGGVDVAGIGVGRIHGFGALDTGVFNGVSIRGGEQTTGNFVTSVQNHWKQTTHAAGVCLMGLRLDVPYMVADFSEQTHCLCGVQWCKVTELHETNMFSQSSEKTQTFLLLVEVKENYVETWFGASKKSLSISATTELKGIVGQGAACAIASFFHGRRQGKSVGDALSCGCRAFWAASLDGALNIQLTSMAQNISSHLSSVFDSPMWAAISPQLEDGIAALVRPVVRACLNGGCRAEDFGREWLKQFVQLQLLRLLRQAGVPSTALQLLSASYSKIFDNVASKNPNLLELLVDLVPVILEVLLKAAVSGTSYGWVLAYVVVPLLLELFKCQSVQCVLGHISKSALGCATALKDWVVQAVAKLQKFFVDVGVVGSVTAVVVGTSSGIAAASAASAALTSAASVAGSQTLGSVAVGLGLIAPPVAPLGAVLAIASMSGVVSGAVVLRSWRQAQRLIQEDCSIESWQCKLEEASEVEVFITKPMRKWVKGVIRSASANRLSVKYFLGNEECQVPVARDSARIRPPGADGATLSVFDHVDEADGGGK